MNILSRTALAASVLGIVLLTGCGGGGSSSSASAGAVVSVPAASVGAFVADLQATSTNETAEPTDISLIELAVDDTSEPI